ncbi:MAG: CBS domain-containing protein [Bacteroidia bacterium]|nr:CBS domain-containing protein [Bacteroidia bacterium]
MITDQYLTNDLEPLALDQTVADAIQQMNRFHIDILPIVNRHHLVNYASFETIGHLNPSLQLSDLEPYAPILPFVNRGQHILHALTHLKSLNVSLMAVVDEDGEYMGILKTKDVVKALSGSLSIRSGGSIIVLRMKPGDYSMTDLSRVIEYSDAKILGLFLFDIEGSDELEVHIKLNTTALKHVLATLERYDYKVVQYFNREDQADDLDERYENLMNYIDI